MLSNFDINKFIKKCVTRRVTSLLCNDLTKNDQELSQSLENKSILVIGGAGSIGSSYIKSILKYKPGSVYVVDTNENGLTELVRDLRSSNSYIPHEFTTYPINFGDSVFRKMFLKAGPFNIVANFAAHKHVRSEKDVFSIEAMISNNVLIARKLLDLLLDNPPEHFFCVSTDKAANPVNIMGASKKLMEELIMAYSDRLPIKTARFANVAFSNGSLPLGFIERLNKRQPWSCPIGIKRFFVSPQEAGEICLLASVLGNSGDIFFPKLDEEKDMIDFSQIAIDLLNYIGLEPDMCKSEEEARQKASLLNNTSKKYPVYFFKSDTSGEKPFEEFYTENEGLDLCRFESLGVIKNSKKIKTEDLDIIFNNFSSVFAKENIAKSDIVEVLKGYLPNFHHIETGKSLDQKM